MFAATREWRQLHEPKRWSSGNYSHWNSVWCCLTNGNKINALEMTKASAVLWAGLRNTIESKPHVSFFAGLVITALIFGIILLQNVRDSLVFSLSNFKCQMVRITPTENVQNPTSKKKPAKCTRVYKRARALKNLRNTETKVDGCTYELNANEGTSSDRTTRKNSIKKLIIKWQTGKWYCDLYLIYI